MNDTIVDVFVHLVTLYIIRVFVICVSAKCFILVYQLEYIFYIYNYTIPFMFGAVHNEMVPEC